MCGEFALLSQKQAAVALEASNKNSNFKKEANILTT
jgi:hypothetical protein